MDAFFEALASVFATVVALAFICGVVILFYKGFVWLSKADSKTSAPAIRVSARVAAKREEVYGLGGDVHTNYYVTFVLNDGRRAEFNLTGRAYGLLLEGDCGMLTFRGNQYIRFDIPGQKH